MPTASGNDTSPIVEAVAGAASEVNATNFTIAKTIATTPVPASEPMEQAGLVPATTPQLASAVATAASKVIKSSDKLTMSSAETTTNATLPDSESPPASSSAVPASATDVASANPHPQSDAGADATPASTPSQVDRLNGDPTTPSTGGHHAAAATSQPQPTTTDALSQLGATLAAPQTPATTAIPAAQLTATAAVNLPVPISGLAVQIAASARAGNSRFEIRLDPAELGRIDVRLDVDRHGHVSSHLTVEKPETLAMLRQDAPQLQRALEDAGLKTGQNGLQFSLRDQSSGQQNNGQPERQPQRIVISDASAAPLVAANTTYSYAAGANRGLDIRV
ncbi:MAG: flagellar hook-length control protein FliK [Xanthobacteraceae bacterium]